MQDTILPNRHFNHYIKIKDYACPYCVFQLDIKKHVFLFLFFIWYVKKYMEYEIRVVMFSVSSITYWNWNFFMSEEKESFPSSKIPVIIVLHKIAEPEYTEIKYFHVLQK